MKWRLFAAFAGLIAVVLLTQDVPLSSYLRRIEFERLISSLERDAFILAGSSENVLSGEQTQGSTADLQSTVNLYAAREEAVVVVTDAEGRVVVSSSPKNKPGEDFSNRPEIRAALMGTPASGERSSQTAGGDLVYVAVPVLSGADIVGSVRITFPAAVIDQRTGEKTRGLLLVGGISLMGAALAAWFMANSITRPLRRLQRSTEHLAAGDFTQRAATDEGASEIRSLAGSYNSMTERISGLLDQQKAFAGDASHQLRTPLTALRLQLERASSMIDDDPEGARERIEAATEETERLQRLVQGLLMIARSEGSSPATERIDVTTLVRDRAEVWEPFAAERGVRLLVTSAEGLVVQAVPNALEQIVDNYVDNALGVASEGDTITIAATQRHQAISVHVIDEGPGMRPEHLPYAFDRFWRAPDAPHGGSGIGLAVVEHLATLSGGRAELRNRDDRSGLDASVVFPTPPRELKFAGG
jgi:signal transduction histidine kinase